MDALNQSKELMLRSNTLIARAKQARATAGEKVEESRQLIAAAHAAQAAMLRAYRVELAGARSRATASDVPAGR